MEDRDLEGVLDLYALVFGPSARGLIGKRWEWGFGSGNLFPGQSPKWILADGDKITGFLATIALPYWVNGREVVAHTTADYMVHPEYRFHGIKLMQEFFRSCSNCVTCDDMRATIKVTQWLGAKTAGTLVRYVKILDGRAFAARYGGPMLPPLWWPVTQALRLKDLVLNRSEVSRVMIRPSAGFDERFATFSHRIAEHAPVMAARDLRFFNWRYGPESPHSGSEVGIAVDSDGELAGYVVFNYSNDPRPNGYILDLQVMPLGNNRVAMALLGYAVDRLRASGAWMVRYHHLASPQALPDEVLEKSGFVPRSSHQLLVKFHDKGLADAFELQKNWNYSYGDSEASYSQG